MNDELRDLVARRLESEGCLKQNWGRVVLAAYEGRAALEGFLNDGKSEPTSLGVIKRNKHPGVYVTSVTVEGFRGIGKPQTLTVNPGPGLTLVVGRNGSGKSSFAEALEVLLTGDSKRWSERPKVWKDGWRSLHQPHPTRIEAEMLVEGQGPTKVLATCDDEGTFESKMTVVQPRGKPKTTLQTLGWSEALTSYRPFLSYNELGSTLDEGPSKLYDTLSSVLGLEELVDAQNTLAKARTERQQAWTLADQQRKELVEQLKALLANLSDGRASSCLDALTSPTWGLDALEKILHTCTVPSDDGVEAVLIRAIALEVPNVDLVAAAVTALRVADARLKSIAGTDADRARTLASLLLSAVTFHQRHAGSDCPVCGTADALGPNWAETTREEIERLRALASQSDQAHSGAERAQKQALELMSPPPKLLDQLFEIGVEGLDVARDVWKAWYAGTSLSGLSDLADHLHAHHSAFRSAIDNLKKAAAEELRRRQDRWRPIAEAIAAWLPSARKARRGAEDLSRIKAAEDWLKEAVADIRNQRFAPIADQAMATWRFLRQNSNVELGRIELAGTKSQRRVTLDVTVDGIAGAALGVMSQGELHSLALSLFLPRATLADSPFRFVLIDDPVQSMDPARVDGLALALDSIAQMHQVIVFTHDDRLPEAVRRLDINASMLSVTRRPKSVVEVRRSLDPCVPTSKMHLRLFTRRICRERSCGDSCLASVDQPWKPHSFG